MSDPIVFFFAFLIAGFIQGMLGFGFAVATTLLLINQLDFTTLVFFNLCMSLLTSIVAMLSGKNLKSVDKRSFFILVLSASAGLIGGLYLVNYVDVIVLKKVTLGIILLASILSLSKLHAFFSRAYVIWISGFLSGALTPSTGINGPLVALHLNAAFTDKERVRNTMLAYLLVIMAIGSISMVIQQDFPVQTWYMFLNITPPSIMGYIIGMIAFRKLSHFVFTRAVTAFLILSSLISLVYLSI